MKLKLVPIDELVPYKFNRNKHSEEQIKRLAKLIKEHGFRDPLSVDQDTMEVITGNGTLMACKLLKMKHVPCAMQHFETDEQKYAFSVSHNAIAAWSDFDLGAVHMDLPTMAPFDLELLGLKDFQFEPSVDDFVGEAKDKMKFYTCPHCEKEFEEKQAKLRVER